MNLCPSADILILFLKLEFCSSVTEPKADEVGVPTNSLCFSSKLVRAHELG